MMREMGSELFPATVGGGLGRLLVGCLLLGENRLLLQGDNRRYWRQRTGNVDTRNVPGRPQRRVHQKIAAAVHSESTSRMKVVQVCTGEPISTLWP